MRTILLVLALAALAGCRDGLSPESVVGSYELARVGGNPVPWTAGEPGDWQTTFVSGSLVFDDDGSFRFTETQRTVNTSMDVDEEETSSSVGSWWVEGGFIVMEPAPGYRARGRLFANRLTTEACDLSGECGVPTIMTRVYVK